jgi:hypothetical protein
MPAPGTETAMIGRFNQFLGGSPLAVIGKLILLSILIGVVLSAVGLDPWNIVSSLRRLIETVWNMGFDAVRWLWQYFLLGAVLVIPIWLIMRFVKVPTSRSQSEPTSPMDSPGNTGFMKSANSDRAEPQTSSVKPQPFSHSGLTQEMSPEVVKGFGITALVLAVISIFVPLYGIHIAGLALICACISAWGGDRTFATATSIITFVNVFFLTPSLELMYHAHPEQKLTFQIFAALCIAAPLAVMMLKSKTT